MYLTGGLLWLLLWPFWKLWVLVFPKKHRKAHKRVDTTLSPLHLAAAAGDEQRVRQLASERPGLLESVDLKGRTPLFHAATQDVRAFATL